MPRNAKTTVTIIKKKGAWRRAHRKNYGGRLRVHRKQRRSGNSLRSMFNSFFASPMPPRKTVQLKYVQTFQLGSGATTILGTQQKFNLNSVFDCDATGGGHQPSGFDQMTAFYHRYKVIGVMIDYKLSDPSIDGLRVYYQILNPSNNAETLTGDSRDVVAEIQQAGYFDTSNTGSQTYRRKAYIPIWKASGLTKLQFDADPDNFTAPVTGDPGSLVQFASAISDLNGNGAGSIWGTMNLTYYVTFYQRKVLPQS